MKKEYYIDSLEKLLNVINENNFDNLMIDFAKAFVSYLAYIKEIRRKYPEKTKDKANSQILGMKGFTWIDDGKNEIRDITIENGLTGEILRFKNK